MGKKRAKNRIDYVQKLCEMSFFVLLSVNFNIENRKNVCYTEFT